MASNNQVDSVEALGELPKGSGLRHVDLSNNCISVVESPQSARAFRRLKSLNLASNNLEDFEEEAALALTSLERLDVSGKFAKTGICAAEVDAARGVCLMAVLSCASRRKVEVDRFQGRSCETWSWAGAQTEFKHASLGSIQ